MKLFSISAPKLYLVFIGVRYAPHGSGQFARKVNAHYRPAVFVVPENDFQDGTFDAGHKHLMLLCRYCNIRTKVCVYFPVGECSNNKKAPFSGAEREDDKINIDMNNHVKNMMDYII
jgi:hypothetical protein